MFQAARPRGMGFPPSQARLALRKGLVLMKARILVGDVRGIGAMCLVEFVKDKNTKEPDMEIALEILKDAVAHGIILIRAGLYSNCIRLLPPTVMSDEQLHEGLAVLESAIERAHEKRSK